MSFFDPANIFGGGGSRFRDPLGIFGRGGGPMSEQQRVMQRTMGPQRFDNQGPVFGGAGMAGGEREITPFQAQASSKPLELGGMANQMMNATSPAPWGGLWGAKNAAAGGAPGALTSLGGFGRPSFGGAVSPHDLATAMQFRRARPRG